ncbi:MAG: hypothetical protein GY946_26030 [bacterium]|nr:hypothetical protein [bacterium]
MAIRDTRFVLCLAAVGLLLACVGPGGAELSAARAASAKGDLVAAHRYYEAALVLAPGNAAATKEIAGVRAQLVDRAIADARAAAGATQGAPGLRTALQGIEAARLYDPTGRGLAAIRQELGDRLAAIDGENAARAKQVRTAIASGRLSLAGEQLAAIRAADPDYRELPALESEFNAFRSADLAQQVEHALVAGDIPQARAAIAQLAELDPSRAASLRPDLEKMEAAWLREHSQSDMAAGRFYTAYLRVLESAGGKRHDALLDELRTKGAEFYLGQARSRMQRGETARAYLEGVKGLELAPNHGQLFEVHRDARDAELAKIQTYVAIPTFATPRSRPDLGAQFSDALISHLFRVLPYGINIVEREKIDLLISEKDQGFAELGQILNVDLIISGNVSLMEIDRQESEREGVARIQVGNRQEANPAYEVAVRAISQNPQAKFDPDKLPPPTLSTPMYETIRYRAGTVTIKGFATVAARIFNTGKASIEYAQEFNARFTVADDFQDAVDGTEIEGDALELPSETEIVESLRNQLVEQVAKVIEAQFAEQQKMFLDKARYRIARREFDLAVKPLARGFLYCVQAKINPADQHFVVLRDLAVKQTERGFLPQLELQGPLDSTGSSQPDESDEPVESAEPTEEEGV